MTQPTPTVRELIREGYAALTASERKVANALLENYPAAGLASITIVAEQAGVSTPTIARMVQKLGFKGFPQFHQALRQELQAQVSGPTERRANWASEAPEGHLLNRFAQAVTQNIQTTFSNVSSDSFDAAAHLLADTEHTLYIVGGRITHALADYAFTHLQAVRPRVIHLTSSSATWPHYMLDMAEGDTLLMFDIRRYESSLLRLAQMARDKGVNVILITDQWSSPIAEVATRSFNCWVEIPSAWDSNISTMMLLEALIAAAQEEAWPVTRERFEKLDGLFEETRLFRKPGS
ncbi:MurR/RpiR family transcriptional regulator [Sagittula sp. S175]|uniref:MurR/RpiR family transcriptional regulator n=1 Tax=Sagittula sp. S175 TaxID=3415129 RepID=UPI003C7C47F2